ncbi:UNVERIFIED_CONTAM: hypothetical protein HDU68_006654 [Siphonaria sp. JEL0065]|nr:hypothetical protein HDU68_006654 [Siphonaria sp. JEL0065]
MRTNNIFRSLPKQSIVNLAAFSQANASPRVINLSKAKLNSLMFAAAQSSASFSTSAAPNASASSSGSSSSSTSSAFSGSPRSALAASPVLSNVPVALANGFMSEWTLSSLLLSKVDMSDG